MMGSDNLIKTVEGVVISERAYGETSKIINIITSEYGVIGVMAKGAKTLKSKLRATTTKLTYGRFNLYYKPNKLSTLISVDTVNTLINTKKDITRISYASYICELASQVVKQNDDERIYKFLISTLLKIEEGFNPLALTNVLEMKYLSFLGVAPELDACASCGRIANIVTLSSDKGGLICGSCHTNERKMKDNVIKLVRMYNYVDIDKISKLDLPSSDVRDANYFISDYYDKYTGLYLYTKKFLRNIQKLNI